MDFLKVIVVSFNAIILSLKHHHYKVLIEKIDCKRYTKVLAYKRIDERIKKHTHKNKIKIKLFSTLKI